MFRKIQISRLTLVNTIVLALFAGTMLSPLVMNGLDEYFSKRVNLQSDPIDASQQSIALQLQENYINVYKKAGPSVVFIKTNVLVRSGYWLDLYRVQEQAGSGFLIDKEGHIVTNSHVVKGARKIEVIFHDNTTVRAKLVGRDEASDVALIKVPSSEKYQVATIGDSDKVDVGQLAFALGAPFGLDRTFTVGTISAKQRQIDDTSYSRLQTDASINPGNSGGPLLNIYGEVVGINQSIFSTSGGNVGIGFAIPMNEAQAVIAQLKKEKRVIGKPELGVKVGVPAANLRDELKLGEAEGVVVVQVMPGSAAAEAGLKEYDFIMMVNGVGIQSAQDLVRQVQKIGVDGVLNIKINRRGTIKTIKVLVGESSTDN